MARDVPQEQSSERKGDRTGDIELPKVSYKESVEVIEIIPQERISERGQVIEVPKTLRHECRGRQNCPSAANF